MDIEQKIEELAVELDFISQTIAQLEKICEQKKYAKCHKQAKAVIAQLSTRKAAVKDALNSLIDESIQAAEACCGLEYCDLD